MEIKQLLTVLPILPASISVLLRGPHGIGKSALPRHVGRVLGLPVVDRRLSQMSEGDLVGLPELVNGVTRFAPPDWYKKACMEPTIVFLDELNRATPEVMQAAFQIVLDRELNGHRLNDAVIREDFTAKVEAAELRSTEARDRLKLLETQLSAAKQEADEAAQALQILDDLASAPMSVIRAILG